MNLLNNKDYPKDTDMLLRIDKIEIPFNFLKTEPKRYKMDKVIKLFMKNGKILDKPITAAKIMGKTEESSTYLLTDGYTRYLAARYYFGLRVVPVRIIETIF